MPAVSKAQQRFMGMVHAADKGETPASPEVAKVSASMKDSDAKDFASTKHKGLPNHVRERIKEIIRGVVREEGAFGSVIGGPEDARNLTEMSPNDTHFKSIMKMYDKGGSFTKKKVGAVVSKNPNASRNRIIDDLKDMGYHEIIDAEDELGIDESINEIEYKDAIDKFNVDLMKNSQVERIAKFHKRSVKDVVKALQPYLKVLRYNDKSVKLVSIDFRDTNSDVKVHVSQTYKQNESVNEVGKLVHRINKPAVEQFIKKYPKVKEVMKALISKNGDVMKGYKAFIKFKDKNEPYLGGRAEVTSSPTFGDKTFYKYDWNGLGGWAEVYEYLYDTQNESVNEEHDCGCNENHDCGCGGLHTH